VAKAKALAKEAGRYLEVIAVLCGTDEDPQKLEAQVQQMKEGGAWVSTSNEEAMRYAGRLVRALSQEAGGEFTMKPVDLTTLQRPLAAINVGLESFAENLAAQGAPVIHVDWRPPAGGNERLTSILERMKQRQ